MRRSTFMNSHDRESGTVTQWITSLDVVRIVYQYVQKKTIHRLLWKDNKLWKLTLLLDGQSSTVHERTWKMERRPQNERYQV